MENTKYIYRNARVIDPATNTDEIRDIGVENGLFADPAKLGSDAKIIDLKGYVLAPGFTALSSDAISELSIIDASSIIITFSSRQLFSSLLNTASLSFSYDISSIRCIVLAS